jgi:prepilin-type N-terminal cleavage/methylation domain-containing protein
MKGVTHPDSETAMLLSIERCCLGDRCLGSRRQYQLRQMFAFTLVELLVVIAIIGVLVALLLPAIQAARESARRAQCVNNLKQIGLAFQNYHAAHQQFPSGWLENNVNPSRERAPFAGWGLLVLPYMEQQPLYDQFDLMKKITDGTPGGAVENIDLIGSILSNYRCPSDDAPEFEEWEAHGSFYPNIPELAVSNYVGSGTTCDPCNFGHYEKGQTTPFGCPKGPTGIVYRNSKTKTADITDGTSNTFLVGERSYEPRDGQASAAYWAGPPGAPSNLMACFSGVMIASATSTTTLSLQLRNQMINGHSFGFHSRHPDGVDVAMADGSTRYFRDDLQQEVAIALVEIDDGQIVGAF